MKFHYGQTVKIIEGFYAGQIGTIISEFSIKGKQYYTLDRGQMKSDLTAIPEDIIEEYRFFGSKTREDEGFWFGYFSGAAVGIIFLIFVKLLISGWCLT